LLNQERLPDPRDTDRERIIRARQVAEALFSSKPPITEPSFSTNTIDGHISRKPRVLPVIPAPTHAPTVPRRRDR
jgi:hypothetical protein